MGPESQNSLPAERAAAYLSEFIRNLLSLAGDSAETFKTKSGLTDELAGVLVRVDDSSAEAYFGRARVHLGETYDCLDFGCGTGPHRPEIERLGGTWFGCDYEASSDPRTLQRQGSDYEGRIVTYNGSAVPLPDERFDVVWSWQSLEHVQEPETSFSEISRLLKRGGILAGSTSFLEPYHAQSTYGYSLFGFKLICERHGLRLIECAPAGDALSYLLRCLCGIFDISHDPTNAIGRSRPFEPVKAALVAAGRGDDFVHLLARICATFRFIAIKI